ncbi:indolepyruvate oxidoreductase subunit beta [Desulfosarcina sp. OttesenSCG-928-A07]|nr:indolepyruvate oxidoreductase subunit beta [Desulfosarcina sp. OttesenSCG-928-G17]MDL2328208.1 indolepyruvate oxidoreductase subunit beta [Desulfosarcina sp. OttesenSCG-928-A07]
MSEKVIPDPLNIIICGVGGQGNIVASELLASALVEKGFRATVGETYGASQRGGSVMSHVRISKTLEYGVLIPQHKAHLIVGFEPMETLRIARDYANKETTTIFDPRPNYPLGVLIGEAAYPSLQEVEDELCDRCGFVWKIPATDLALSTGNFRAANIALMGALTALPQVPVEAADYDRVMAQRFPEKVLAQNQEVFVLGYEAMRELLEMNR